MRKLLAIFLLVLIPLQTSWAVAAEYCSHHEEGAAAQHFGHHADEHSGLATDMGTDDGKSDSGTTPNQPHNDNCHHYSVAGLLNAAPLDFHDIPDIPIRWGERASDLSASTSRIERPNWASLA